MPDISMCSGEGCPMRDDCFRFRARPSEYRQSYFMTPPIKDGKCGYLWPIVQANGHTDEASKEGKNG